MVIVDTPQTQQDIEALTAILDLSFNAQGRIPTYIEDIGRDYFRVARLDGRVVAGLAALGMAQFYGGERLSSSCIAAVGVAPEVRGRGVASGLMHGVLREAREKGFVISALFPSNMGLYERCGYARSGTRVTFETDTTALPRAQPVLPLRKMTDADVEAVQALQLTNARTAAGHLERNAFMWKRAWVVRDQPTLRYVVEDDAAPVGYVSYLQSLNEPGDSALVVTDWVAATPEAVQSLWAFMAQQSTLASTMRWPGHPTDVFAMQMFPAQPRTRLSRWWMTRLLDVPAALEARGYPAAVEAELDLDIHDALFEENAGRLRVRVAGGKASVERGGNGTVQVDVGGLAAAFTGFAAARTLLRTGLLQAEPEHAAVLDAVFAGPSPWMPEQF